MEEIALFRISTSPIGYHNYGFFTPVSPDLRSNWRCSNCGRADPIKRRTIIELEFEGGTCASFYSGIGHILISGVISRTLCKCFPELKLTPVRVVGGKPFECDEVSVLGSHVRIIPLERHGIICQSPCCIKCGQFSFELPQIERFETFEDMNGELAYSITKNDTTVGLGLSFEDIGDVSVIEYGLSYLLCTSAFRLACQEAALQNIDFLKVGNISFDGDS